jgi:arylsulfatase A-like enzyme
MDVYPTLAVLAGAKPPDDRVIDGRDIRALMFGEPGAKSPHEAFYYYYIDQLQAVRSGRWKLYLPLEKRLAGLGGKVEEAEAELYDLVADLGETKNLADAQPDVVRELMALADRARGDLGESDCRGPNVRPVGTFANPTARKMD